MFDIYGIPPNSDKERRLTLRYTQEEANAFVQNLSSFGYKSLRVVDTRAPSPGPNQNPKTPAPAGQSQQQPAAPPAQPAVVPQQGTTPTTPAQQDAPKKSQP